MTNLLPYSTIQNTAGDGAGAPGAAPLGATMQGNPQSSQYTSTYGQSQFTPANGGASNIPQPVLVPVTARVASALTYPAPGAQNHTGN